jgi:hypothetical protein
MSKALKIMEAGLCSDFAFAIFVQSLKRWLQDFVAIVLLLIMLKA